MTSETQALLVRLHNATVRAFGAADRKAMSQAADTIEALTKQNEAMAEALQYLEAEARRFAGFYPEASDRRNTFVIFADKIAALTKADQETGR